MKMFVAWLCVLCLGVGFFIGDKIRARMDQAAIMAAERDEQQANGLEDECRARERSNPSPLLLYVTEAPSGPCELGSMPQLVIPTGAFYVCGVGRVWNLTTKK